MKEHMKANCLKRKKETKIRQVKKKAVDGIPSCEVCLIDFSSTEAHNEHNQGNLLKGIDNKTCFVYQYFVLIVLKLVIKTKYW